VQELAVVLCEADDRRARARAKVGEGRELAVLLLLCDRVDWPPVRTPLGIPEPLVNPLDHVVAERIAELVRVHVRLGRGVPHEVRQQPLDDPMLAHDPLRALATGRRE
jgi:hypothetical protein